MSAFAALAYGAGGNAGYQPACAVIESFFDDRGVRCNIKVEFPGASSAYSFRCISVDKNGHVDFLSPGTVNQVKQQTAFIYMDMTIIVARGAANVIDLELRANGDSCGCEYKVKGGEYVFVEPFVVMGNAIAFAKSKHDDGNVIAVGIYGPIVDGNNSAESLPRPGNKGMIRGRR